MNNERPMTRDEIEIAGLKKDLIEAQTTITNLAAFLQSKKAELRRTRAEYSELVTDYLNLRKLQKEETEMLDYILDDVSVVEVRIEGTAYIALDREEIKIEMEKDDYLRIKEKAMTKR